MAFYKYEGAYSLDLLEKRKKLDIANRSVKLEAIPKHITKEQIEICIFHKFNVEITESKVVNQYQGRKNPWSYSLFVTFESFKDVDTVTNNGQYWAIRLMGRDIKISPVMISDEDRKERYNTVKITGLKDNTYVTELSLIINLIYGKATIIPER